MLSLARVSLYVFFIVNFGAVSGTLYAQDILPSRSPNTQNTVIINKSLSENSVRPSVYNLKRWIVEEKADPVKRALEVYKEKATPKYAKRVWITDKNNGQKRLIVEYLPRNADDKVVFSPNEDFMYYLGITPSGASIVYGINLESNKKFSLGAAQNFNMVNCPDKKSFVVVQDGKERSVYQVYTATGERMKSLTNIQNPTDIEKSLCR